METINPKDQLFYDLIYDLTQDIINDTQESAEQIISLSSQFLDSDSQMLVSNFHDICIHDDADQTYDESVKSIIPDRLYKEQISKAKESIKHVVNKDDFIKAEINVVISAMQFTEMLRQHLEGLRNSFYVLIHATNIDIDQIRANMLTEMHTYDERKAYFQHVMHKDMPAEDAEITQALIDELIG